MGVDSYDIAIMQEAYARLGSYAAVARETGHSASTVSKYLKANPLPADGPTIVGPPSSNTSEEIVPKPIEEITPIFPLADWFKITEEEIVEAEIYRRRRK